MAPPRMVLYHYDFIDGTEQLNLKGREQLAKIADLLHQNDFPIVVERTAYNPGLDEARRLLVLNELTRNSVIVRPNASSWEAPLANGLRGVEGEIVHLNLTQLTQSLGRPSGGALAFPGGAMMLSSPSGGGKGGP